MKYILILLAVLSIAVSGSGKAHADTTSHASYVNPSINQAINNYAPGANHNHQYTNTQPKEQRHEAGLGLDVTVYENEAALINAVDVSYRRDFNNDEGADKVYLVGKINLWDKLFGEKN